MCIFGYDNDIDYIREYEKAIERGIFCIHQWGDLSVSKKNV